MSAVERTQVPGSYAGYHNVPKLKEWLEQFIDSPYSISYPTARAMSAALPDVLKSLRYEMMMREGKKLSPTWNFGVVALTQAIGQIAQAFRGDSKGMKAIH